MGVAVLIDQRTASTSSACAATSATASARHHQAITLEKVSNPRSDRHAMLLPTVHADACTGCGKVREELRCWSGPPSRCCRAIARRRASWAITTARAGKRQPGGPPAVRPARAELPCNRGRGDVAPRSGRGLPTMPSVRPWPRAPVTEPRHDERATPSRLPWLRRHAREACRPLALAGRCASSVQLTVFRSSCSGRWAGSGSSRQPGLQLTLGVLPLTDPACSRRPWLRHWPEVRL